MRPFDIYGPDENIKSASLSTICDLMLAIESGELDGEFEISEPDVGPTILHLEHVGLCSTGASSWLLSGSRHRSFVAMATGRSDCYLECGYVG